MGNNILAKLSLVSIWLLGFMVIATSGDVTLEETAPIVALEETAPIALDLKSENPRNRGPFGPFDWRFSYGSWDQNDPFIEIRKSYPEDGKKTVAHWLVVAGRQVIPDSVYRIAVEALYNDEPLTIRAALVHDHTQVTSDKLYLHRGELGEMYLKVPDSSVDGKWQLRIEGQEGVGKLFKRVADLGFSPKFLTIIIQPSRPVYNSGQTVRFRAIFLTRELKPYDGPVDVYVLDPRGRKMRRWPSHQTGDGVLNLSFQLPEYPLLGDWTLRVVARSQVEDMKIKVEHYFRPRFEVFVRLPHVFKTTDEVIEGVVVANMTNWRYVYGNLTLKLQYAKSDKPQDQYKIPDKFSDAYEEYIELFDGYHPFEFNMSQIETAVGHTDLRNTTIRVWAAVGDVFGWRIQEGWAMAKLIEERLKVAFLGDQPYIFRPGMPATFHVYISYDDGHPLSDEELEFSELRVIMKTAGGNSKVEEEIVPGLKLLEDGGVAEVTFDIPEHSADLKVDAIFRTFEGKSGAGTLIGIPHHSPRDRHLSIETTTLSASPGEFITLHVRNNFYIQHFNFIIMSKGVVVYNGREPVLDTSIPTVTTFSIPASSDMAPVAHFLVWVVTPDGQVVAHSVAVPVNPIGKHEVGIRWNEHKDHTGGSVEMKMLGEAGSFFAVSSVWEEIHKMDSGHELDEARVINHMLEMEKNDTIFDGTSNFTMPLLRRAASRSREGGAKVSLFSTAVAGPDAPSTFNFSNLIVLTDADLFFHPHHSTDSPDCPLRTLRCLTSGCYNYHERCDGVYQCSDRSDEWGCPIKVDPHRDFRLNRLSRMNRFYDAIDGDWAWQDLRRYGGEINVFPIPKRPQNWVVSMFAVGKESGLGILQEKIAFDSAGPFMITLEGPKVARQWEQVGLRACVFNFHSSIVGVLVTLPDSDDYRSVMVEENGRVRSYNPRTVAGDHQHIVWLPPDSSLDVNIPIVFTRMGTIEVTVIGSTQMQKDSDSISIEVVPEGVSIGKHTSILLDLKNRALAYDFLDIHLDESPIIPYSLRRRFIYDTPAGHISVTGDVVGPAFPEIPVGSDSLLGLEMMGAETAAFNFAANLWTLHYLRLTNQIEPGLTYRVLTAVNVHYATLARYQDAEGSFRMWPESEPSVWLTAYALKTLWLADFQDWENWLYIDREVINSATQWILNYQSSFGSFTETPNFAHPLDSKSNPQLERYGYKNVSLTAQVVIAIESVLPALQGDLRMNANTAKTNAVKYLEKELDSLIDPYDVAIVAWALTKADSVEKESAYNKLHLMRREEGSKIYWSREPVSFNPLTYEDSQRPFIQPKDDQKWDAHAVETTSYALLVYIAREGIGIIQENIVRFLTVMRELDGGLISTLDSVAAMEALVEYSYRARLRDVTDMRVNIEHSANPNFSVEVLLGDSSDLAQMRSFDLQNIWGHISITGHGSGQALVQLDYSYGVDYEPLLDYPPVPAFDFTVDSRYSGRNNSHITITSCQKWTDTDEAQTSGVAVVEIHLPSGYYVMQDDLITLVNSRKVRNLRWALRTDNQVKFFFNHLDTVDTCVSYEVERWYPVSNHSRYNMARVYDLYQPERFNMTIFEVFPLYDLDVCEVCGSYKCPYCPFYSKASSFSSWNYLWVMSMTLVILIFSGHNLS